MRPGKAEALLGGYATGNLSELESQTLFTAALERQDLFDALMDEEALRELLSDPAAKAQLLAALSPVLRKRTMPRWRHPGLLGAAAGLIVAATAGLAYLRSPRQGPPAQPPVSTEPAPAGAAAAPAIPAKQDAAGTPVQKTMPPITPAEVPVPPVPEAAPARQGAPSIQGVPAPALAGAPLMRLRAESGTAITQDKRTDSAPTWALVPQPDGNTLVTISALRGSHIVLLRRAGADTEVLKLQVTEGQGSPFAQWHTVVRLASGDALDLYQLATPVAEPAQLPESDPVAGSRIRIHPAAH